MQEVITKLKLLGQMPDAVEDDPTEETINLYDELLSNVKTPLTKEEVKVLIDIFPEGGMYVLILTFDELYQRIVDLIAVLSESPNQQPGIFEPETGNEDLPF